MGIFDGIDLDDIADSAAKRADNLLSKEEVSSLIELSVKDINSIIVKLDNKEIKELLKKLKTATDQNERESIVIEKSKTMSKTTLEILKSLKKLL